MEVLANAIAQRRGWIDIYLLSHDKSLKLSIALCFTNHLDSFFRKHRVKRSIKVPAISNKLADIPSDDYSWRKYGQKPIKGSPHPRYN